MKNGQLNADDTLNSVAPGEQRVGAGESLVTADLS